MSYKEQILELRGRGLSYSEIVESLGCALSTVAYHCGEGQKEKTKERHDKWAEENKGQVRVSKFQSRVPPTDPPRVGDFESRGLRHTQTDRSRDFQRPRDKGRHTGGQVQTFTFDDVLDKYGDNPVCYLSGRDIDWQDPSTWSFDHKESVRNGGDNSLGNLGVTHPRFNRMKCEMSLEDFLDACEEVLRHHGRIGE